MGLSGGGSFPERFLSWQSSSPFPLAAHTLGTSSFNLSREWFSFRSSFYFRKHLGRKSVSFYIFSSLCLSGSFSLFSVQCEEISFNVATIDQNHFTVSQGNNFI